MEYQDAKGLARINKRGERCVAGVSVRQDHDSKASQGNVLLYFDVLLDPAAGACTLEACALDGPSAWAGSCDVQGDARHATVMVRQALCRSLKSSLQHSVRDLCSRFAVSLRGF